MRKLLIEIDCDEGTCKGTFFCSAVKVSNHGVEIDAFCSVFGTALRTKDRIPLRCSECLAAEVPND